MIALSPDSAVAHTSSRANTAEQILDYIDAVRPSWQQHAACAGHSDVMYPTMKAGQARDYDQALAFCDRCPVRSECADMGRGEQYGIWGGVVKERRKHPQRSEVADFLARNPGWWTAPKLAAILPVQGRTVHRQLAQLRRDGLVDIRGDIGTANPAAEYRLKEH
jgi:hypothetical protein